MKARQTASGSDLVNTDQPFQLSFASVRWSPGAAADADATPCSALVP